MRTKGPASSLEEPASSCTSIPCFVAGGERRRKWREKGHLSPDHFPTGQQPYRCQTKKLLSRQFDRVRGLGRPNNFPVEWVGPMKYHNIHPIHSCRRKRSPSRPMHLQVIPVRDPKHVPRELARALRDVVLTAVVRFGVHYLGRGVKPRNAKRRDTRTRLLVFGAGLLMNSSWVKR